MPRALHMLQLERVGMGSGYLQAEVEHCDQVKDPKAIKEKQPGMDPFWDGRSLCTKAMPKMA